MPWDPFEVLGIAADASLDEARSAYRRVAALFHPDHLQGMRDDVRAEGEKRLRQAGEALEAITAGRLVPHKGRSDPKVTAAAARSYNAQVRALDPNGIHADWGGQHAAAVWAAMHRAYSPDGPVRQVEWGAYECTLHGSNVRRLLGTAFVGTTERDWRGEPIEDFEVGRKRVVGTNSVERAGSRDLGWLADQIEDRVRYLVIAEVF